MKKPEEIVKALEICVRDEGCFGCPYMYRIVSPPVCIATMMLDAADLIKSFLKISGEHFSNPGKTSHEWISVNDILPSAVITPCLICANGQIEIADWSHDKYENDWWFYVQGEYEIGVTHWMQLPEPQKED